jgi:hypothetical protein
MEYTARAKMMPYAPVNREEVCQFKALKGLTAKYAFGDHAHSILHYIASVALEELRICVRQRS